MYNVKVTGCKKVPCGHDSSVEEWVVDGNSYTIECEEYHVHRDARQILLFKFRTDKGMSMEERRYVIASRTFAKEVQTNIYVTNDQAKTIDRVTFYPERK